MNTEKTEIIHAKLSRDYSPEEIITVRDEYIIHIFFLTHVIIFYSNFFKNQNMTFIRYLSTVDEIQLKISG